MRFRAGLFAVIWGVLAACQENPADVDVLTSVPPMRDLIQRLAGEKLQVRSLLGSNQLPHRYQLQLKDTELLQAARLIVLSDALVDGWVVMGSKPLLYLSEDASGEHVWLSISQTRKALPKLVQALSNVQPQSGQVFASNARALEAELEVMDQNIRRLFTNLPHRSFLQGHRAWTTFAADYGLQVLGDLDAAQTNGLSITVLARLSQQIQKQHPKVLVLGSAIPEDNALKLQELLQLDPLDVVRLDSLGESNQFPELIWHNAERLADALRK